MGLIILSLILSIACIFIYKIPIIGAILCIVSLTIAIKLIRGNNYVVGLISLIVSSVTFLLSIIIILITFQVIAPTSFNIGYDPNMTKVVNSMLISNKISRDYEEISDDIENYFSKKSVYNSNGLTREEVVATLFKDSSNVKIYYSSNNVDTLKDDVSDKLYDETKPFVALRDSDVDYYLIDFDKLYDAVKPVYQVKEEYRNYWLIDKEGKIYLNIEGLDDYVFNK